MSRRTNRVLRRGVILGAITALCAVSVAPVTSHADTSSTLTVVGTSDVFDSDLVQDVIKPDFEKAYPQYTLNYVSVGTGAAINYAEAGTASALLVHAASLENQFVAPASGPSYSYEQYGRAIFYGDYILLGPAADPAGVMTNGKPDDDIVDAFQKIAATGASGGANFVSRGGTPGTTVEEHQIWNLTSGVPDCPVSAANGGGDVPNATSDCTTAALPSWYHTTGLSQGPNVVNADTCSYTGGNCYVLTDRGTYQFLKSEGAISNLVVVAKGNNGPNAKGGPALLINSFHAYAINPARFTGSPNVHININGAEAFLNWLTSPAGQTAIGNYQSSDPGGSSFLPDAAPSLSHHRSATRVRAGTPVTISGTLANVVPGTPPLQAVQVSLSATAPGATTSTPVTTGTTDSNGKYSITFTPTATATYTVSTPQIAQIENATLTPQFGDLLQPTSANAGKVSVVAAPAITSLSAKKGVVTIKGTLAPAVSGSNAHLSVYADKTTVPDSSPQAFIKQFTLANGARTFTEKVKLTRGHTWRVSVKYVNAGQITAASSGSKTVHVR